MSTLGKVLAILNVLAAIGFLVLAGMDYSRRQNWAYAHFRGQIALNGLPVDKSDATGRLPGRNISDQLGRQALQDIFRGTQGGPVETQIDEVNAWLSRVRGELDQAGNVAAQVNVLAKYLLPLASYGYERDDLVRRLRAAKEPADIERLKEDLNGYFQRAAHPKKPSGEDRDYEDRRRSIADLLYALDATPEGRARTQTVVGIDHYIGAAERQYGNLRQMAQRLRTAINEEQAAFVKEYQGVLPDLARLAQDLKIYENKLAEQQEQVQKHTAVRNASQSVVMDLQKKIQDTRQQTAAETADLDALQRQLFALQQDFAKLQAGNQRIEGDLRAKESGR